MALRATLDAHYDDHPSDRPDPVEVAQFLVEARRLDIAQRDDLSVDRASTAVRLLLDAAEGPSVVDAHVAAAAADRLRGRAGTAVVVTSDPSDLSALLAAEPDTEVQSRATVRAL